MNAEKENTFRALKDEDLFVISWLCRFGWHKWTKYREPTKKSVSYRDYLIQERRCGCCNITNTRIIEQL